MPSCGDAFPIVKKLQEHFGDKLRFVFRNFPLEMHPYAEHAAEAAEFAADQDKFWEMHDLLYKHQRNLTDLSLTKLAKQLGLSTEDLAAALESGAYAKHVKADLEGGVRSGVSGTPMFYINGKLYDDSYDYDTLAQALQEG